MRFKLFPDPPADLDAVADAQRAVPLVPDGEDDCCERLLRRLDLPTRDVARTWLTFLRALELVEETDSGFKRRRIEPTPDRLRAAFRERVFAAEEALAALREATGGSGTDRERGEGRDAAGRGLTADETFDRLRERIPTWERQKNPTEWESIWRGRTADLLEWFVLLGLAERDGERYRAADR